MQEIEYLRILMAFMTGYFLTIAGSLAQIVTHNGLASPSTLGFDGVSVLCILIAQFLISLLGLSIGLEYITLLIFLGLFGVFVLSKKFLTFKQVLFTHQRIEILILFGLAFNLFVGAIFSVIQFLFMALNLEFPSSLWFGNLKFVALPMIFPYLLIFLFVQLALWKLIPKLRTMSVGHDFAIGLGVPVKKVQEQSLHLSLLLTGVVVAFFGVFSFLGLIFPHLLRLFSFFRFNMRNELIYGPLITGLIFSALDMFCYHFTLYGTELPVGMVSSVLGAFFLLILLVRKHLLNLRS
jgi:iron complex transport system permease protein